MELRGAKSRFKVVRVHNIAQVLFIGLVLDSILREWLISPFHGQMLFGEPYIRLAVCQSQFSIQPPVPKSEISPCVHSTSEAGGVEDEIKLRCLPLLPAHPPHDFSWGMAVIFTIAVRPMHLVVIIGDPAVMLDAHVFPRFPLLARYDGVKVFRGGSNVPVKDDKTRIRSGDIVRLVDPPPKAYQQALLDEAKKNSRDYAFVPGKTAADVGMGKLFEARPETNSH